MILHIYILACMQVSLVRHALALDDAELQPPVDIPPEGCNQLEENASECDTSDLESAWEYEPRVWTPDGGASEQDFHQEMLHNDVNDANNLQNVAQNLAADVQSRGSFREKSHFYETNIKRILGPDRSEGRQILTRQQVEGDKCDQFRVDIRETVICDRQRCDKLEFEWPKYDNQMIVVQTTKAGMRFYQAHLDFQPPRWASSQPRLDRRDHNNNLTNLKVPIKFDILDLFKPKPSSTTPTPSTTTIKPSSSTTEETTEESESPTTTSTTQATTASNPFGVPGGSVSSGTPPTIPIREPPIDKNATQLVTTFRLDTRRRMQRIVGFGGALSDSTCRNIKSLSPTMAKSLVDDYFGPKGLQYTIVRMSMGSSDFSITPYTNNDKPYDHSRPARGKRESANETDDVEMRYFHLTEEDFDIKLPMARQAIATSKRKLKFFSSLWSPPTWMKNNSHIVHGYLKGDVYGPYYKALADLIVKWLEAYREQGIEFWATTGLNEPITGVLPFIFHNSLGITRDDYITWIKLYLGPMLKQRGFPDIKLIIIDDNKGWMPNWAGNLLEDETVAKYVSGIGVHWYMNDDYENLNFLIDKYPDKFILATEACNGYFPFQVHVLPGDWDRGVAYMYDIMNMMHKNAVGWVDWNMVLNINGGPSWAGNFIDAAILVNADRDEYYKSPTFYAMGHYSRFVVPDSYRLDHRLANARYDYPLTASGFYTPDEYVVIVVLNANRHQVPFKIIVDRQLVKIVNLREESFNTIVFRWKRHS